MEIKILKLRGIKCKECGCDINKGEQYNKMDGGAIISIVRESSALMSVL